MISQARFKWTDNKYLQDFKSSMEFKNCDSNANKVKLYGRVKKSLAEIYEDQPHAFGPASVSENPHRDLCAVNENQEYQVKVKTENEQIKRAFLCPRESKKFLGKNFLKQSKHRQK